MNNGHIAAASKYRLEYAHAELVPTVRYSLRAILNPREQGNVAMLKPRSMQPPCPGALWQRNINDH